MPRVYHSRDPNVPVGTVYVGRGRTPHRLHHAPSKWYQGNPFKIGPDGTRYQVIEQFQVYLNGLVAAKKVDPIDLAGRDLACWCAPMGQSLAASATPDKCHAQYLLYLANKEENL